MTDNPIHDAQDHLRELDMIEHESHHCANCGAPFCSGFGGKIEEEKFCGDCLAAFAYIPYYQDLGIEDEHINKMEIIQL